MRLLSIERFAIVSNLTISILFQATLPVPAHAQFGRAKRAIMIAAVCGGGAYGGYKLGQKIAELEAKKLKLGAAEAAKHRRAFEIGMALAVCGGGALVANSIYGKLSKRDLEARNREMEAAVADADPATRNYVLPDSKMSGEIKTEAIQMEGKKECRTAVDHLADAGENAMVKYCRNPPDGKFEVEL